MSDQPISVAVVGHTNTGKTSLMRTLLRDCHFGDVAIRPGTTRHVEGGALLAGKEVVVELFDTPGLEDSIGLLEFIESMTTGQGRERLQQFIDNLDDASEFDQEAKVVRQLLGDDLILYLIDCREPVLGKYRDELKTISMAARPVIPVLNFVADDDSNLSLWHQNLADLGLHATVEFDTVIFNFEDEKRLYQKMQALLASRYDQIQHLINWRQQEWDSQVYAAAKSIANLIIDAAAYRQSVPTEGSESVPRENGESVVTDTGIDAASGSPAADTINSPQATYTEKAFVRFSQGARTAFHHNLRQAERDCINTLLRIFRFDGEDIKNDQLPIQDGRWELDLFDTANLKEFGLDAGSNAAKGAAVGVGIDAMTGGLTLGAAAMLGAAAGLAWTAGRKYKNEINTRLSGQHFICIDDNTLRVLWFRQSKLLKALMHRGHAAQEGISVVTSSSDQVPQEWRQWMRLIRRHPEWSALNQDSAGFSHIERDRLIHQLASSFIS